MNNSYAHVKFVNEKFTEDSDPVEDLGIGTRKKITRWMEKLYKIDTDNTALASCAEQGKTEWVKFLLARGADVHYAADHALRWAARKGHTEIVKMLLDAGADVHVWGGYTLLIASKNGHTETAKVLEDYIAKEKKTKGSKKIKESLNEKFVEDSDPVEDLGLGTRGKVINELKALSISKDDVIFKNDTFFLKNNLRHTYIEDFYQLQLKYFPPAKKKILEDINDTPKDIKKIIDEAVKNNVALDEIQELIDAAFKYIGARRAIYQQFDRRDIRRETQVAKIYLAKLSRTKEKTEQENENNVYVFIGYTKKVPVTIDGEQYFKNRLGVEKIIKIDNYDYSDLQAISMMKIRVTAQGYENGAVYMIRVPKDLMDEDSYSDIPDFAYDIFDKYKIKI